MWKLSTAAFAAALLLGGLTSLAGAEEDPPGKKIYLKLKCQQCHTIEALNISKVEGEEEEEEEAVEGEEKVDPPDLSGAGKERTAEWHAKWLKKEEKTKKGRKHKKKFKGTAEELTVLSAWLATLKYDVPKNKQDGASKAKAGASAAKKDSVSKVTTPAAKKDSLPKVTTPVVKKDSLPKAATPAAKKDSVSKGKVAVPAAKKDSVAKATTPVAKKDSLPKAATPAAKKDSVAKAKAGAPPVRKDTAAKAKDTLSKARKDSLSKDIKAK